MDLQKVENYLLANSKYFAVNDLVLVRETLLKANEQKTTALMGTRFNDPVIVLVLSIIVGSLGVDRFLIGDIGLGILKLVTCGGFGIWVIVDWFLIMDTTRKKNMEKLKTALL